MLWVNAVVVILNVDLVWLVDQDAVMTVGSWVDQSISCQWQESITKGLIAQRAHNQLKWEIGRMMMIADTLLSRKMRSYL